MLIHDPFVFIAHLYRFCRPQFASVAMLVCRQPVGGCLHWRRGRAGETLARQCAGRVLAPRFTVVHETLHDSFERIVNSSAHALKT